MKSKFNVTIEAEVSIPEILEDGDVQNILTKLNSQNQFLVKKQYIILKVDDKKIKLKKGKWFKKFNSIKLINIEKSYILDNCPELVLVYVCIRNFHGYIVLRIHIAGNMMDFTEFLKKILNHKHIALNRTNIYYEAEAEVTDHVLVTEEPTFIITEDEMPYMTIKSHERELPTVYDGTNGPSKMYNNTETNSMEVDEIHGRKHKIYRVEDNQDNFTFINYNSEELINNIGPVALYSQTYPSPYSKIVDGNYQMTYEDSESDSDSQDSLKDMNYITY